MPQPVRCADSITMPSLDDGSSSGAGTTVTVAGWGTTSEGGSSPNVLHSVDLKLLTNAQCEAYGYRGDLISSSICAIGDLKGGEDSCQGDSGGPLFVQHFCQACHCGFQLVSCQRKARRHFMAATFGNCAFTHQLCDAGP